MQSTGRQSYLDWLRILAILGVLFFHSAMPFAAGEQWHIRDAESSNLLLEFNFFLSRFRMPLLFFISGAVAYYMLCSKSPGKFVKLRFQRLIVPLVFGMLIIVPPQVYMERITQGFKGNFFEFYPTIFEGKPYPKGNTSWHHLWFIAYLFIYDLVGLPFFAWFFSASAKALRRSLDWFGKGKRIYLLLLPGLLGFPILIMHFPRTNDLVHDWGWLPYWFYFFLVGFLAISSPALTESLRANRRTSLLFGILSILTINYFRWNRLEPWEVMAGTRAVLFTYGYLILSGITAWSWVFALVGYGKQYLNRKTAFSDYANQAVYPFYILHQTVIVILAYYVVQTNESIIMKYLFITLLTLFISVAIYHLLIRPYAITRFLFGMKKDVVKKIHTQAQEIEMPKERLVASATGG